MGLQFVWSVEFFGATYMCPDEKKNSKSCIKLKNLGDKKGQNRVSHRKASPEGTLVFLKGLMNEHVSLHFVFPVERRLTEGTFVWLFTWKMESTLNLRRYFDYCAIHTVSINQVFAGNKNI